MEIEIKILKGEETDLTTPRNKVRHNLNLIKMMRNEITKVVTIFMLFFLGSCSSTEVTELVDNDVITYIQVGIDHNEALEKMFIDLKQAKGSGLTYRQAVKVLKKSACEITCKKYPELEVSQMETIVNNLDKLILSQVDPTARTQGQNLKMHEVILNQLENELTDQQNTYLKRIVGVVTTGEPSLETINQNFDQLENEVRSEVSEEDAHALLVAIYTGRASAQYWHDNHSKWESEFGNANVRVQPHWYWIVGADIAAGAFVGYFTSPAFAIPFAGWGFWGLVTVGSAAVASGGTAYLFWYHGIL